MKGYDLDEKGGLFGIFSIKSPTKIIKKGDVVDLKHYSTFSLIKAEVLEVTEDSMKIQLKDIPAELKCIKDDHVVLYNKSSELCVLNGTIDAVHSESPFQATVKIGRIERVKDEAKSEKFSDSLPSSLKVIGIPESVPAVVKKLSLGGIKINCREDIVLEDTIDVTVTLDKANKLIFKGRIVKKNKLNNLFEYGIEILEMPETTIKNLHRYVSQHKNDA